MVYEIGRTARDVFDWTQERKDRFEALWNQTEPQIPTAELGRLMGISKNAAVGKAHRMGLPGRPNPVVGRPWTDVERDALKADWLRDPVILVDDISRNLRRSAHAIVQEAKRIGLPRRIDRGSKLGRSGPGVPRSGKGSVTLSTPPSIAQVAAPVAAVRMPTTQTSQIAPHAVAIQQRPAFLDIAVVSVEVLANAHGPARPAFVRPAKVCDWPMWGKNDKPSHVYCSDPVSEGRRWCHAHCVKGYVKTHAPMPARAWT